MPTRKLPAYGGGNGFKLPDKKEVDAIEDFPGWKKLGGKSMRTKNIRSATPRGFALAVFQKYGKQLAVEVAA